jgi:hypothetical protein
MISVYKEIAVVSTRRRTLTVRQLLSRLTTPRLLVWTFESTGRLAQVWGAWTLFLQIQAVSRNGVTASPADALA